MSQRRALRGQVRSCCLVASLRRGLDLIRNYLMSIRARGACDLSLGLLVATALGSNFPEALRSGYDGREADFSKSLECTV